MMTYHTNRTVLQQEASSCAAPVYRDGLRMTRMIVVASAQRDESLMPVPQGDLSGRGDRFC
jgi:hypothetical protein